MKGLIIIGSAQVNSHTSALARYLTEHFKTHDIEAEIFDLAEKPLNQLDFSGTTPAIDEIKQNMKDLKEKAMAADFFNIRNAKLSWFIFWNIEKCIRSSKYGLF